MRSGPSRKGPGVVGPGRVNACSGSEDFTTPRAAACQDLASVSRSHARTETVGTLALEDTGLKGALHLSDYLRAARWKWAVEKRGEILRMPLENVNAL